MQNRTSILMIALICVAQLSFAVNVNGPYNNSHTYVEYTTGSTGQTWLYAVNAIDKPRYSHPLHNTLHKFNRMEGSSGLWDQFDFLNEFGNGAIDISGYPSLLGWSNYFDGQYHRCMVVATPPTGYVATTVYDAPRNGYWWEATSQTWPGETRFTRLVVNRDIPGIQWMACQWIAHADASVRVLATADSWQTAFERPVQMEVVRE